MRSSRKNTKINKPFQRLSKQIRVWYSEWPTFVIMVMILLIFAVCGTSYGVYRYVYQSQNKIDQIETANTKSLEGSSPEINSDFKSDTKASTDKKDDSNTTNKTTPSLPGPKSGGGCIVCDNNPTYSIITSFSSTEMRVGSVIGPFTAQTSDGTKVNWSTPASSKDWSPFSYITDTSFQDRSSITFYIHAGTNVEPGSYQMQMTAIDPNKSTRARHFATILVTE